QLQDRVAPARQAQAPLFRLRRDVRARARRETSVVSCGGGRSAARADDQRRERAAANRAEASASDRFRFWMLCHTSPAFSMRSAIVRSLNVRGPTAPDSTSSHVHGADTGAPGFARTVYGAANGAL